MRYDVGIDRVETFLKISDHSFILNLSNFMKVSIVVNVVTACFFVFQVIHLLLIFHFGFTSGLFSIFIQQKIIYRELLIWIKRWAKSRLVYGLGYPVGIGYGIMVAYLWTLPEPPIDQQDGINKFFKTFSCYNWTNPIKLDPSHKFTPITKSDKIIAIVSPSPPYTSCSRSIIKSCCKTFIEELNQGIKYIDDYDLLILPREQTGIRIIIDLQNSNLQTLGRNKGIIKSGLLWIWINLERYKVTIDPINWTKLNNDHWQYGFYVNSVTDTLYELMDKLKKICQFEWFINYD